MTHQSIYINHQGELLLIDAPEKPKLLEDFSERLPMLTMQYEAAIASAIAKGVKFKPIQQMFDLLWEHIFKFSDTDNIKELKGQTFPLPTGYNVSLEYQVREDESVIWSEVSKSIYNTLKGFQKQTVAILSKLEEEKCSTCGGKRDENMYCSNSFHLKVVAPH